jgi:hypothetical protein
MAERYPPPRTRKSAPTRPQPGANSVFPRICSAHVSSIAGRTGHYRFVRKRDARHASVEGVCPGSGNRRARPRAGFLFVRPVAAQAFGFVQD